ncbi:MAG: SDR family NAD(P)-dependent oxidoreductase [Pyrinomonadaceae bacterium]|nr:SDR family NAD(P)-dependent oxidoreductase [Pyrinomonadaceae bacterium]
MSLTNKSVVVITGAASGIGRALAIRLAQENISGLAISDLNEEGLANTRELIDNPNLKITTHIVDVASEGEMRSFAGDVIQQHGRVTHVINNAGAALGGAVSEVSVEDIRWLMDINFWGVVYGSKFFLPHLEKEDSAHIVNISSLFGFIAPPGQATYCASKFAVRGFTESLRHELEKTNIAVSLVHPGGINTNIVNNARIGENVSLSEKEVEKRKAQENQNINRTSPEKAAETILRGIKSKNPRILIGFDSWLLSTIARVFPKRYFSIIDLISGGRLRSD